jgi:hypothetical protein
MIFQLKITLGFFYSEVKNDTPVPNSKEDILKRRIEVKDGADCFLKGTVRHLRVFTTICTISYVLKAKKIRV